MAQAQKGKQMARALGTDDAVTTCDCCGRSNLKFTVIIELDCGDIAHYGQVCAARNTGKAPKVINAEIRDEAKRVRDAASAELRASYEWQALMLKLQQRPRNLIGRAALDYIIDEDAEETAARARIAAKFGLKSYEVMA